MTGERALASSSGCVASDASAPAPAVDGVARRLYDWPEHLSETFEVLSRTPFAYGLSDCVLFNAACADAITGGDLYKTWVRRWTGYAEGLRVGRAAIGVRSIDAWASHYFPAVDPALAHRGDWALVVGPTYPDGKIRKALAVFDHAHLRCAGGIVLPRTDARKAWSVE